LSGITHLTIGKRFKAGYKLPEPWEIVENFLSRGGGIALKSNPNANPCKPDTSELICP
jgi:hypothetical protein